MSLAAWLTPTLVLVAGGVLPDVAAVLAMLAPLAAVAVAGVRNGPSVAMPVYLVGAVAILLAPPVTLIFRPDGSDALLFAAALLAYWSLGGGLLWVVRRMSDELSAARHGALFDDLTGIPNRRYARMELEREFAAACRGRPLVVAIADVDDFKRFNDRFGHTAGDRALRAIAISLKEESRAMNVVARWGGEEFLVLLSGTDLPGAGIYLERLRQSVAELRNGDEHITLSIGAAAYSATYPSPEALLSAADSALYTAKASGGNTVRVHAGAPVDASPALLRPRMEGSRMQRRWVRS